MDMLPGAVLRMPMHQSPLLCFAQSGMSSDSPSMHPLCAQMLASLDGIVVQCVPEKMHVHLFTSLFLGDDTCEVKWGDLQFSAVCAVHCEVAHVDLRGPLQVASAYGHEPVATTSLLAYVLCHELHPSLEEKVNWLGVLGTFGDLGSGVKWQPPFPDMGSAIKQHGGKQKFSQAVSLINARESACIEFGMSKRLGSAHVSLFAVSDWTEPPAWHSIAASCLHLTLQAVIKHKSIVVCLVLTSLLAKHHAKC